jgi:hypothetical protein
MAFSDSLKKMRASGYPGGDKEDDDDEKESSGSRILKLSDDEAKAAGAKPGQEVKLQVSGTLEEDGHFHVMSVEPAGGGGMPDEQGMAAQVAGQPPMMPGM